MTDIFSKEKRSAVMRRVRSCDTRPELLVRRLLHQNGYRYRIHVRELPGKPDIVFPRKKKAIFVHGCFWHLHGNCRNVRIPNSNRDYWVSKLENNKSRDLRNQELLRSSRWQLIVLWECELKNIGKLESRLKNFLGPTRTV